MSWFGAMQAQDYPNAKWAVGIRSRGSTDATVGQDIAGGTIIRTWLMRGTLHFVARSDVRWILALLAPRIIAQSARRYRHLDLDERAFADSYEALARALEGGKRSARAELLGVLEQAGIAINGQRGYHILRRAALDGLICLGPMQGRQQTYVLLDEWVPRGQPLKRGDALGELAARYFRSHGPATVQDFAWWSGLPAADARAGLDAASARLHQLAFGGQTYWSAPIEALSSGRRPAAYLLPAYDEYLLGYKARDAVLDDKHHEPAVSRGGIFRPVVVLDGQVVGVWKRTLEAGSLVIAPSLFASLTEPESQALHEAAGQYGAFLGQPVVVTQ
ncbi:MAG: winged helix DNA-binding domain-containing protein [Anaerolineae bacterium]